MYIVSGHAVDREVREIGETLERLPVTQGDRRDLSIRVVAVKVRADIATNASLFVPFLDVVPEGDGPVLRGVTHTPKEHKRIEDEGRRPAGDVPFRSELHYRK